MQETEQSIQFVKETFDKLRSALTAHIVGQDMVIDQLLLAMLADGHVLLEGVPGTAKTFLVKTLAALVGVEFGRIQLTPDMLPSDIVGTNIFDLNTRQFTLRKGPIFTSLLLADEINRTPPKTQSALLEAMEERQVTLDGQSEKLSELFMVVATQNPVEFEGTYPLPEAQLDRFMIKILIGYPQKDAEKQMLRNWQEGHYRRHTVTLAPVARPEDIIESRRLLTHVKVQESIIDYLSALVHKSRNISDLQLGASPRAALAWLAAAKAHAAMEGRDFITPDNIKFVAEPVLRHRLLLTAEAELDGVNISQVIGNMLKQVEVPR
ncbi:MAG: MoxR family ATPase [Candidatus Melainabacteria bacterium]|jgi:MoxR-like ATPase|nr:MoxR family ATPase [Candidatus Melainabacteria bacterium]MBX9671811.1 MoxR family ATPase [Candidatus Obscuribacterales bacterium]